MENSRIECSKIVGEYKLSYEKLRHKNIMEELEFMAKHGIKGSPRGGSVDVTAAITRAKAKKKSD